MYDELYTLLRSHQQEHVLAHWPQLDQLQKQGLASQIRAIDFEQLSKLTGKEAPQVAWSDLADAAEPPPAVYLDREHPEYSSAEAKAAGESALRAGKVGMIMAAGGQGTRLGFDRPKGMFPIGPLSGRTLFEIHANRLKAVMRRYDTSIPMYVMTSPATDTETRAFFDEHDRFGLAERELIVFCQGTMPALDMVTGRILMSGKGEIALSPDGHGGLIKALDKSGCLADATSRGIDHFYYGQVDNPLIEICDPRLLGYHVLSSSDVTTQVVKKRFATEKVGNVVFLDGHVQIIEYIDLPDNVAKKTNPDGSLMLWAGNIAVHVFERSFLEETIAKEFGLPFHRALKVVPYVDDQGQDHIPQQPNATKFEQFVFDLLPMTNRSIVVEGDPKKIFAPVKNADGAAFDTPESARRAISQLHREWLEKSGAKVSDAITVEIHPRWAIDENEVAGKIEPGLEVVADTYFQ